MRLLILIVSMSVTVACGMDTPLLAEKQAPFVEVKVPAEKIPPYMQTMEMCRTQGSVALNTMRFTQAGKPLEGIVATIGDFLYKQKERGLVIEYEDLLDIESIINHSMMLYDKNPTIPPQKWANAIYQECLAQKGVVEV